MPAKVGVVSQSVTTQVSWHKLAVVDVKGCVDLSIVGNLGRIQTRTRTRPSKGDRQVVNPDQRRDHFCSPMIMTWWWKSPLVDGNPLIFLTIDS